MLTAPAVIWATVSDQRLDDHIASFLGHRQVHCAHDPDRYNPGIDEADIEDEAVAVQACTGCPIRLACREQALRQEQGVGQSHGIRGGMTARARTRLIERRPGSAARTVLPTTWNVKEVLAFLASCGYRISRSTLLAKCVSGTAPAPLVGGHYGRRQAHWDIREVRTWAQLMRSN